MDEITCPLSQLTGQKLEGGGGGKLPSAYIIKNTPFGKGFETCSCVNQTNWEDGGFKNCKFGIFNHF